MGKLARIPKRISQDLKIIRQVANWRDVLSAKRSGQLLSSIRLRNGVVLNSPKEVDLNFLFHEIWLDEFYAPTGYDIGSGETVIDIGANIGVFALYAATRASGVEVSSFEPFPKNAEYFIGNKEASNVSNIKFYQLAIGDGFGTRTLHVDDSWILHSLTDKSSNESGLKVQCIPLDKAVKDVGEQCDLLKLDCEGGEYEILYSASDETLTQIKRIVCEFNILDRQSRNGAALRDFLSKKGFHVDMLVLLDETCGFICAKRDEQ